MRFVVKVIKKRMHAAINTEYRKWKISPRHVTVGRWEYGVILDHCKRSSRILGIDSHPSGRILLDSYWVVHPGGFASGIKTSYLAPE